jgi:nucleoside-diphosphate kinase
MLIKPDAMRAGNAGNIIAKVQDGGFSLVGLRMLQLTAPQAREFYLEHEARPFYGDLVAFMTSGPIIALLLEREGAIKGLRGLVGATDSRQAEQDTIRGIFGTDNQLNAVHASDSLESAARETAFYFNRFDRPDWD